MLIGQTNDVKFRVNVMGTGAEATARVVLGTDPQLVFPATKSGDQWSASIKIPEAVEPGSYEMKVEVMVGNRHFTPLTKSVDLERPFIPTIEDVQTSSKEPAVDPLRTSVLLRAVTAAGCADASVASIEPAPVEPSISKKQAELPKKQAEQPKKQAEQPKKITLPKDFFKFEPKKVDPVKIELKPLISRLVHSTIDRPLAKEAVIPTIALNQGTPVRLVKGEIIYE